jgi:hypothetical protein
MAWFGYGCSPEYQTSMLKDLGVFGFLVMSSKTDPGWLKYEWSGEDWEALRKLKIPTFEAAWDSKYIAYAVLSYQYNDTKYLDLDTTGMAKDIVGPVRIALQDNGIANNEFAQTMWVWDMYQVICLIAVSVVFYMSVNGFYLTFMYKRTATLALVILGLEALCQFLRLIWLVDPFAIRGLYPKIPERILTTLHQPVSVSVTILVVLYWRQILTAKGGKQSTFLSGTCAQASFFIGSLLVITADLVAAISDGTYNQQGANIPYLFTAAF